jgi:sterol 3beta-glucosyltransferase
LAELQLSKVPFLYNFSPHVAPKPSDWGDLIKVTGYWFVKQKQNPANIPKDLEKAIENAKRQNKKIVYIGFGSVSKKYID